MKQFTKLLIPQPSPFELIRIGGTRDGAYLVPDDLDGIDACFSPGVNNFKDFEDELVNKHGIKCHMCDFTSDLGMFRTPLIDGMQTFTKKWLDTDGGPNSISLKDWVNECSPEASKDLLLQIDIEGAEYHNLLAADTDTLKRFRIIVIELHRLSAFKSLELMSKEVGPLLAKLSNTHISVHAHPNNCCGDFIEPQTGPNIPNVIEITYLRRDRFTGDESHYIQPKLPHPLDISRNVRGNPPIHLNEAWLSPNKREIESELKALRDDLDYANWEITQLKKSSETAANELMRSHQQSILNLYSTIQEALAMEDPFLATTQGCDLAAGKKYFLSKGYASYPIEGIIREDAPFFFHTAIEKGQSITIDLGKSTNLQNLVIRNRIDSRQERAKNLFYVIHESSEYSPERLLPVAITDDFLRPGDAKSVTPLCGKKGRYLTIFSPLYTALHFSSISVF